MQPASTFQTPSKRSDPPPQPDATNTETNPSHGGFPPSQNENTEGDDGFFFLEDLNLSQDDSSEENSSKKPNDDVEGLPVSLHQVGNVSSSDNTLVGRGATPAINQDRLMSDTTGNGDEGPVRLKNQVPGTTSSGPRHKQVSDVNSNRERSALSKQSSSKANTTRSSGGRGSNLELNSLQSYISRRSPINPDADVLRGSAPVEGGRNLDGMSEEVLEETDQLILAVGQSTPNTSRTSQQQDRNVLNQNKPFSEKEMSKKLNSVISRGRQTPEAKSR